MSFTVPVLEYAFVFMIFFFKKEILTCEILFLDQFFNAFNIISK